MACHRSLYDDVGGFDADRDDYGSDDWEFASRAFNNGAVLIHDPDAVAWHDEPDWAGRDGRLVAKNSQTLYVAGAATEPQSRGPGLIHAHPDTIVRVGMGPGATDAQIVVTIQCLLAGIADIGVHVRTHASDAVCRHIAHDPRVRLQPPSAEDLLRCRTVVDIDGPAYWTPEGLRDTVAGVRPGGPGVITVEEDGEPVATVASTRARGRIRRAGGRGLDEAAAMDTLFGHAEYSAPAVGLHRLHREVDLAGYFGGWATP